MTNKTDSKIVALMTDDDASIMICVVIAMVLGACAFIGHFVTDTIAENNKNNSISSSVESCASIENATGRDNCLETVLVLSGKKDLD